MIEKLFKCECCSHGISVTRDDNQIWFSIWRLERALSLWERLRLAWIVLQDGHIANEVILDESTAKALGAELCEIHLEGNT